VVSRLRLRPVTRDVARAFVAQHHRHNGPPLGWVFGVGLELEGELVAVGMAGRPVARLLDDGCTLEITRCCTLGTKNAASMVYGALGRAAAALGYRRVVTYILEGEPGTSLRAAGFHEVQLRSRGPRARDTWATPGRPRYQANLWGEAALPEAHRRRWERDL
jgi:hypothetical protein